MTVLPLRVTYGLIKLSLFEQVTAVEFTKIRRQYLAFTLDKISNPGELKGISKLSILFSAGAVDRNAFSLSVSSACHMEHVHNRVWHELSMSGLYMY